MVVRIPDPQKYSGFGSFSIGFKVADSIARTFMKALRRSQKVIRIRKNMAGGPKGAVVGANQQPRETY